MIESLNIMRGVHPARAAARRATVDAVIATGAVAVVRLAQADRALHTVDALMAGGVIAIEVTLTTPGALELIEQLSQRGNGALIGAGSVLTADVARQAIDAGARYIVSPVFDADVMATAHTYDVPAMPGAYTPTEILTAYKAGADLVKVFPADTLGPSYIKGVMAPMPFLELMPTGGVTPANVGTWLQAGAVAVGLGGALVDPALVAARDWRGLTARAQQVQEQVALVRATRTAGKST
ncbi:MAG TPA: bifunctional 4-hydroxy-2-oxoglutarate aldolase/2-dehydro-3-deoxy-phosphogluconate aldolase [Gemmatimonas sp.]|uniref:bifunctional 4-hydroxy-2-oxoglutarate aldolase/2-dehydro-3-deoxy-phosphogluconate aldolase n=1 Tax=Gemmatimonas sp. TaxID=1962908 RepID=UPI002ED94FDE